jgi:hypothetical protein
MLRVSPIILCLAYLSRTLRLRGEFKTSETMYIESLEKRRKHLDTTTKKLLTVNFLCCHTAVLYCGGVYWIASEQLILSVDFVRAFFVS